jgi:uncharacterized iron-regulated membrane protein
MKLRKVLFWLHLTAGVVAGTVVFIMSVTGVALMYEKQVIEWADRDFRVAIPSEDKGALPMGTLVSELRESRPEISPTAVTVYADPGRPALVSAAPGQSMFVDPYTGAVLGEPSPGIRKFFRSLTDLHRWLAASTENRAIGRTITGVCNLAFLFIVCSGVYLWLPTQIKWFKRGASGRARDFNWHNTFGFWAALPLFFIVLSGVVMSYPWANNLVYRLTGTQALVPNAAPNAGGNRERRPVLEVAAIDASWIKASAQVPEWRSINLRLPVSSNAPFVFAIDRGNGGQPQLRSTLTLDRKTHDIVNFETFDDQNAGRRTRTWMRFVHTGEFYGATGQTVAGLASAAGAMLVFTGLSLAFRRLYAWLGRRWRAVVEQTPLPS